MAYDSDFYDAMGITKVETENWDNGYNVTKTHESKYQSNNYEITYYKSSEFKEYLEKINFVSWGIDATYQIYYKNGNESYKLLDTVHKDFPGLITINAENVILDKNLFSIKVVALDENGKIEDGINAFTSNVSDEEYLEIYTFDEKITKLPEQLIVRNIPSGTKLNYYVFDEYGKKYNDNVATYVINGTANINYSLPSLKVGKYYLTLDDNFFDIVTLEHLDMQIGSTYQLEYEANSKLIVNSVSYVSSNSSVAIVSDDGLIQALTSGTVTITLKINDTIEKNIEVNVIKNLPITNIDILENNQTIYLSLIKEFDLHLNIEPKIYSASDVEWESSNLQVATIDNGHIEFIDSGEVTIEVSSGTVKDSITFNVINSTSNINLTAIKTDIEVGESLEIERSRRIPGYHWFSSNDDIAVVNDGIVTGISNGEVWIYYQKNNDIAGIKINVIDSEKKINLYVDPNGGKYEDSEDITIIADNSLKSVTLVEPIYEATITLINDLEESEKITHKFLKYNLVGDGSLNGLDYTFGFQEATLTAIWEYNSYTLPIPVKENKMFVGWYKDRELTNYFGRDLTFVPVENITLYASFVDIKTGDLNQDSEIDITDLVILRKYLAYDSDDGLELLAADLNHDDNIDITDLVILRRYLAGLEEIE